MNEFFDQLNDLFTLLSGEQAIWAGFLAVLLFALGIIIGWIVQGSKTRRYKKELLLLRKDRDEYEIRYRNGEAKQKALAKELEAVSREKVDVLDRVHGLENDLAQRDFALQKLQQEKEELSASNQSYSTTIESLNDQMLGLKTQNEQLLATGVEAATSRAVDTELGGAAGAGQGPGSNENLNAYILASESRFQYLEGRLAALHQENTTLKQPVTGNPFTGHQPIMDPTLGVTSSAATTEPLIIRADTAAPGVRTGNRGGTEVIVQATPSVRVPVISAINDEDPDDLTRINNVGPFLQNKLYEANIYNYKQIANWSEADIVTYTELIGYIPGIIQRDDWIGQARALADGTMPTLTEAEQEKGNNVDPAPTAGTNSNDADQTNLKLVEGIGPKIESVLKDAGISTMSMLAEAPTERLREILDGAGSRFKSHDPKTWPVQAGLATDGKFKELKAWQKEMKRRK